MKTRHLGSALIASLYGFAAAAGGAAPTKATYSAVYYLTPQTSQPLGITEGTPGVFYSNSSALAIFSVTKQGSATVLASFPDPPNTVESIPIAASNGLFYSSLTLAQGASYTGQIFSVGASPGTLTIYPATSFSFSDLAGTLPNGNFFGIAYNYSNNSNNLATVDLSGNVKPIYQFPLTDRPYLVPIYANGNYYGVSQPGGGTANDYFYQVTPSGSLTKVATLPFYSTIYVGSGLVLKGTDGNFYGVQSNGLGCPNTQHGGVYKLTPSGQYTLLHDFGPCGIVTSLIEGSDGKLYGALETSSTLFSLTKSGTYSALFTTTNGGTQGLCPCWLVQGSDGIIYGTASGGGPGGFGVVFALNAGLPPPKPRALEFTPHSGAVGTQVQIWGYNLLNASVSFNGVTAAAVTSEGPNYVLATVPTGAISGPITVTTPGGSSTTKASFTVK